MALTTIAARGSAVETASDTTIALSPPVTIQAGRIAVACVGTKNIATTDGATNTHVSVEDNEGNVWTKIAEYTETAAGVADDGATASIFVTLVKTALVATTDTITATLSSAIGDKCMACMEVSSSAGYGFGVQQVGVGQDVFEAAVSGMPSRSYLLVGFGAAVGSDNTKTPDADYGELYDLRSRNNAAAVCVHLQARIATLTADTCTSTLWTATSPVVLLAAVYEAIGAVTNTIASGATVSAPEVAGTGGGADQFLSLP